MTSSEAQAKRASKNERHEGKRSRSRDAMPPGFAAQHEAKRRASWSRHAEVQDCSGGFSTAALCGIV